MLQLILWAGMCGHGLVGGGKDVSRVPGDKSPWQLADLFLPSSQLA